MVCGVGYAERNTGRKTQDPKAQIQTHNEAWNHEL